MEGGVAARDWHDCAAQAFAPVVEAQAAGEQAVSVPVVEHVVWARAGKGPSFLECEPYRFEAHNTALRATDLTYRTKEELESWKERDPLLIAAQRLDAEEGWASEDRAAIDFEVETEIEEAIARASNSAAPLANTALDHMYAQTYPGFPAGVTE